MLGVSRTTRCNEPLAENIRYHMQSIYSGRHVLLSTKNLVAKRSFKKNKKPRITNHSSSLHLSSVKVAEATTHKVILALMHREFFDQHSTSVLYNQL